MKLTINFLSKHRKELSALEKQDKKYYKWILTAAISISGVACVIVGISLFFHFQARQVLAQKERLERAITNQEGLERSALVLYSKLESLSELINLRRDKQQAIAYFTDLFGEDVLIKDIDYLSEGGILSLRLESESIFAFERVVDLLESEATTQRFSSLAKSDLTRMRTGSYSITVTVVLNTQEQENQ